MSEHASPTSRPSPTGSNSDPLSSDEAKVASQASASGAAGQGATGSRAREAGDSSVQRKLLTGVALLLAIGSIYAGMFEAGRLAQITLAAGATIALVMALTSRTSGNS